MNFLLEIHYCSKCVLIREVTGWLATLVKRRLRAPYCECPPDDMFPVMTKEYNQVSPFIEIANRIESRDVRINEEEVIRETFEDGAIRKNYTNEKLVDTDPGSIKQD